MMCRCIRISVGPLRREHEIMLPFILSCVLLFVEKTANLSTKDDMAAAAMWMTNSVEDRRGKRYGVRYSAI